MKKLTLLTIVLLVGIVVQSNAQAGFRLGLKGGLNFANIDTDTDASSRTGYHVGAFATIKVSKFAIQPELIYSSQGAEFEFSGVEDAKSNFNYLNIPVLLKLYLIGGLNLQLGPQFGFLLNAESDNDVLEELAQTSDLKDAYKGSDVSLGIGAGIDLPFGLTADARYNLGLSEIDDNVALASQKNQVFQLSIGYRFISLGK
ncbi:PorT family protein [Fulvivirga sp. M361]|uniref:porin family protein n=1 Tax=Fulvivirga sp. M361 TaxID=2594266 RepID=UPI001179ECC3|nr:porin family protein [Fulvivirga sp. M361]TRX59573.1 PorT family protein [Fulvivirga sp. M361]